MYLSKEHKEEKSTYPVESEAPKKPTREGEPVKCLQKVTENTSRQAEAP